MRIAARLALHAPPHVSGALDEYVRGPARQYLLGYHGCDIVVSEISEAGFSASIDAEIQSGAVVRLRLPGAGVMVARVNECAGGVVSAAFVNPVPSSRLKMTLGMRRAAAA